MRHEGAVVQVDAQREGAIVQVDARGGDATVRRVRARVEGTVQGVGFRPFVYKLARELELSGHVLNDERGVSLEVEGEPRAVQVFLARLSERPPALARVERVSAEELTPGGLHGFEIRPSARAGAANALVSPDVATCEQCLRELLDPADRRYRYPFINCTDCGPRFTIVLGVPYDRPATTMRGFRMCELCEAEYHDPTSRRFHAQPNACPRCGPSLRFADRDGKDAGADENAGADDPLLAAVRLLQAGGILAVKGLGGFHLACLAFDEQAVATLRARKHRESRPFAVMACDLEQARQLTEIDGHAQALLESRERPIVLAPRRTGAPVGDAVAPGCEDLGLMLPYSPLHHLLMADCGQPLVMTSGNRSDEPIAYRDDDALARLRGIADGFLLHDRPIHMRTDDSVVRAGRTGRAIVMRRSRGHVPDSLALPLSGPPLLACGAELKSTFCLAKDGRAWVSHHIGDLSNWETLRSFEHGIEHFERLFAVRPGTVVHDLHPDYLSTRYALERDGVEHLAVQHHHAHLAACLAEHGVRGRAVGAIYDGAGLGEDGAVWGGELLVGDLSRFERVGHLWPVRLPGGDRAAREPWRMACAWLTQALGEDEPAPPARIAREVPSERWRAVAALARGGTAAPPTTSVGRLFDAVAALAGIRLRADHEGQAATELEALADRHEHDRYELDVVCDDGVVRLDARPTIRELAGDVALGRSVGSVSARFHNALAHATAQACEAIARASGIDVVVLSGGVFQNRMLLERTAEPLEAAGLRVLNPLRLPPNDGGISYGQAAIATGRLGAETR